MCDGCYVIHVCWNTVRGYESAMEPNSKKNIQIRSGHMLRLSRPHSNPSNMSVAGSTSNQSLSKLGLWMAERKQQRSVSWEVWDFPLRPGFLRELWLLWHAAGLSCANWSLVVVWPAMVPFGVSPVSQCPNLSHPITSHNYPLSTTIHNYPQVLFIFCRFLSFLWHFYAEEAIKCIPCIKPQIAPEVGWHWTKKALASWVPWVAKVWKNHVFQCSVFSHQTLMLQRLGVVNGFFSIFVAVLAFIAQVTGLAGEIAGLNGGFFWEKHHDVVIAIFDYRRVSFVTCVSQIQIQSLCTFSQNMGIHFPANSSGHFRGTSRVEEWMLCLQA